MRLMTSATWGWQRYVLELARIILGAVFVGSGLTKIQQPFDFLADVYSYELVGPGLGYAVAFTLPWLEFTLGVCLIGSVFPTGGLLLATLLLAVFTAVKASAVHRQLEIGCGCQVVAIGGILGIKDIVLTALMTAGSAATYAFALARVRRVTRDQSGSLLDFQSKHPGASNSDASVTTQPGATPGRVV